MKKFIQQSLFVLCMAVMIFAQSQASATTCYTKDEAEAEQGIRIHSELMVIGLNCTHMGKRIGKNLYADYRSFTARHGDIFARYDDVMKHFFVKRGDSNPEASLNTLRTGFANKISEDAAGMRPDVFCANYALRMDAANAMSRDELENWAGTFYPSHPVKYPICGG